WLTRGLETITLRRQSAAAQVVRERPPTRLSRNHESTQHLGSHRGTVLLLDCPCWIWHRCRAIIRRRERESCQLRTLCIVIDGGHQGSGECLGSRAIHPIHGADQ